MLAQLAVAAAKAALVVLTFAQAEQRGLGATTLSATYADAADGPDSALAAAPCKLLAARLASTYAPKHVADASAAGASVFMRIYIDSVGNARYALFAPMCSVDGRQLSAQAQRQLAGVLRQAVAKVPFATLAKPYFCHLSFAMGKRAHGPRQKLPT